MPQVINTNMASLNAQRNLDRSQNDLRISLQRLSSGLRINSAKDDAAGLAISERFGAQVRGLNQAIRNANDGISFAQTAEGALEEVSNAIQRIRQLSVQAVNDTNSSSDREAINNEVSQLIAEVTRIAEATQFNGQNILDGSLKDLTFQVGANKGQTISVNGVDARAGQLGAEIYEGGSYNAANLAALSGLSLNGIAIDVAGVTTSKELVAAINEKSPATGVTAQLEATRVSLGAFTTPGGASAAVVTINGRDIAIQPGATAEDAVDAINTVGAQIGVTAELNGSSIVLVNQNGAAIKVADADDVFSDVGATEETHEAGIILATDVGKDILIGGDATQLQNIGLEVGSVTTVTERLSDVSVTTRAGAEKALRTLDFALQQINGMRAELGAVQSRFESTIANLATSAENLDAARSRIRDADFAAETSALTRAQILQQAGTAMLAQANAVPQNVLSLLG